MALLRSSKVLRIIFPAVFLLFAGMGAVNESAEADPVNAAYNIKAAFIYNFAIYVDWPAEVLEHREDPLVVGVVGSDTFADLLERTLVGKTVRGHSFMVKRWTTAKGVKDCQIVFFAAETHDVASALSSLSATPTLTVGDSTAFADAGGMVTILLDGTKIIFDINAEAARRSNLSMSSRLLSLARRVR